MLIPKAKPLVVSVPKDPNFRIPEGKYCAKIISVKKQFVEKISSTGEMVKLLFEVQVPSLPKTLNLAKAEFKLDMNCGSDLRNVLTRLFGKQALADATGGSFDLEQLEGKEAEIEIEHVITNKRDEYTYPLVKIRDIQPLRTQVEAKLGDQLKPQAQTKGGTEQK
jgi:hypothetical protein